MRLSLIQQMFAERLLCTWHNLFPVLGTQQESYCRDPAFHLFSGGGHKGRTDGQKRGEGSQQGLIRGGPARAAGEGSPLP